MRQDIDAALAADWLLDRVNPVSTEHIELALALDRVLAEDYLAAIPIPPFDRSPYDGYAFRGEDTRSASPAEPCVLRVLETIPAGSQPRQPVTPGTASRIMTGAPIPEGANATIKYEVTTWNDQEVRLFNPVLPNTDIVRAGEDIGPGEQIARRGTVVSPAIMGLLASQGIDQIEVFTKPVIAVLTGGSELVRAGQRLEPAQIYNSNIETLRGYIQLFGACLIDGGGMPDQPEAMAGCIREAAGQADLVITTGGASVGDCDYMIQALQRVGADILFWKCQMKPGGSILAATLDGKLILGLSGNPGAALLGLLRIALPAIRKLCGRQDTNLEVIQVRLKQPLSKKSPKMRLLRGRLQIEDGQAYLVENPGQGNGIVSSFVGCDLLGEIPAGSDSLPAETLVKAYRIGR